MCMAADKSRLCIALPTAVNLCVYMRVCVFVCMCVSLWFTNELFVTV